MNTIPVYRAFVRSIDGNAVEEDERAALFISGQSPDTDVGVHIADPVTTCCVHSWEHRKNVVDTLGRTVTQEQRGDDMDTAGALTDRTFGSRARNDDFFQA